MTRLAGSGPVADGDSLERGQKLGREVKVLAQESLRNELANADIAGLVVELGVDEVKVPRVDVATVVSRVGLRARKKGSQQVSQPLDAAAEESGLTLASDSHSLGTSSVSTTKVSFSALEPTLRKRTSLMAFWRLDGREQEIIIWSAHLLK